MKKLAFVTSEEDPGLIQDDRLAIAPLQELGYSVAPLVWDSAGQNGGESMDQFDAFIFRSCWNYHRKYELFLEWILKLEKLGRPVLNSIGVSRWNLNKKYLLELEKKGASVPVTEWIARGHGPDRQKLEAILARTDSDCIVIKPAISLNGHETFLLAKRDLQKIEEVLKLLSPARDILIQEYIPEIKTAGEVSLIFFNGEFSHAIRKLPGAGEFRIHAEYGGSRTAMSPSPELIAQAQAILKMAGVPLLFCRVDLVERDRGATLIELEIIDPMLFLGCEAGAPRRFAEAIAKALGRRHF